MTCVKIGCLRVACLLALCCGLFLLGATPAAAQCNVGPAPQCGGPCPPDGSGCGVQAGPLSCACEQPGGACYECPPGPHFLHAPTCGPLPDSDMIADNGVLAGIDLNNDCVVDQNLVMLPCPMPEHLLRVDRQQNLDDSFRFPGTRPIDGHRDVIDTEIISMCLTGGGATLLAGTGAPSMHPLKPSWGVVAEDPTDPALADSFFDVFVELQPPVGQAGYNLQPSTVQTQGLTCLPPSGIYHKNNTCLPFFTKGVCVGGPNNGLPCVYPQNCAAPGTCQNQQHAFNLVVANHHVNPKCEQMQPPQCGATCPNPGEICVPNTIGTGCICQSDEPTCEGSAPQCNGPCPAGLNQVCVQDGLGGCRCDPPVPECGTNVPPTCPGPCPNPGDICVTDAAGCHCEPPPCAQDSPPQCDGPCPNPGEICMANPDGTACGCVTPCGGNPPPQCFGPCPNTTDICVLDAAGCHCEPRCEQTPAPMCNGICPNPNDICVESQPGAPCVCEPRCETTQAPQCNGDCPNATDICTPSSDGTHCICEPPCNGTFPPMCNGFCPSTTEICVPGAAGAPCHCEPIAQPCDLSAPACNGDCPNLTDICITNADGTSCTCQPPCNETFPPMCNGSCPNTTDICVEGPAGAPCVCQPACEGTAPQCNGSCPIPGDICVPNAVGCGCVNPPQECELTFPACNGDCPNPQDTCILAGNECICEPIPCQMTAPMCNGPCPNPQDTCIETTAGDCICEPVPCLLTAPACNGPCPNPVDTCVQNAAGDCFCQPPPTCATTPYPTCNGPCPVNSTCKAGLGTTSCLCCPSGPPPNVVNVQFVSKIKIIWNPWIPPCGWYNMYRTAEMATFTDTDGDGLADDYGEPIPPGSCDLTDPEYDDAAIPSPGTMYAYLPTIETPDAEGSKGSTSTGLPRPNYTPCP